LTFPPFASFGSHVLSFFSDSLAWLQKVSRKTFARWFRPNASC
jgi:hypothetical protein